MSQSGRIICPICYENIDPCCEDLQAITVCGHVFHELCLQQWLEYCPQGRKPTCPVCKQTCRRTDAHRLYFQASADLSQPKSPRSFIHQSSHDEETIEVFRLEVEKLQGQLAIAKSALLAHQDQQTDLASKLENMKAALEKSVADHQQSVRENRRQKEMLVLTQEELARSSLEFSNLHAQNMALSKELASLKLIADVNLEEDDALRLATVGRGASKDDVIDTLIKSLILRNRTYKELMFKCNELGRNENMANRKSTKATEQLKRLRLRVHELEKVLEEKENGEIRSLKKSTKCAMQARKPLALKNACFAISSELFVQQDGLPPVSKEASEKRECSPIALGAEPTSSMAFAAEDLSWGSDHEFYKNASNIEWTYITSCGKDGKMGNKMMLSTANISATEWVNVEDSAKDRLDPYVSATVHGSSSRTSSNHTGQVDPLTTYNAVVPPSVPKNTTGIDKVFVSAVTCSAETARSCKEDTLIASIRREAGLLQGLVDTQRTVAVNSASVAEGGTECLISTTARSWCNQAQMQVKKRPHSAQNVQSNQHLQNSCGNVFKGLKPTIPTGSFIVTGADGRGGQIKVLKPPQPVVVSNFHSNGTIKRKQYKENSLKRSRNNPQSTLQMEHFFCHTTPE